MGLCYGRFRTPRPSEITSRDGSGPSALDPNLITLGLARQIANWDLDPITVHLEIESTEAPPYRACRDAVLRRAGESTRGPADRCT